MDKRSVHTAFGIRNLSNLNNAFNFYKLNNMKFLASIIALYFCFQANGQIFIDKISGTDSYQPTIAIYGTDPMKHRIPYNRIKGTPFWKPDWQLASFYDSNAVRIYTLPVKYNLATHEVHYQLKGEELVLDNNAKVSAIVFHNNNDSTSVGTLFVRMVPHLLFNNKPFNGYVQTMNLGKVQLMKLTNRNVVPFEDSLFHTQKTLSV